MEHIGIMWLKINRPDHFRTFAESQTTKPIVGGNSTMNGILGRILPYPL
jgi:hypothetical protein